MQVEELIRFIEWVDRKVRAANIVGAYQQLSNTMQTNIQPNAPKQPFESQRLNLMALLKGVSFASLNETQIRFGRQIGLNEVAGEEAYEAIQIIFLTSSMDIATAYDKILKMQQRLGTVLQKLEAMKTALGDYFKDVESDYSEALVHVRFTGDSSIRDITELKKWSGYWFEIGLGLAQATGSRPEDIKVIGASHGSLIVDLAVTYSVVDVLTKIALKLATVAEKYFSIRKQAAEVRALDLANDDQELQGMAHQLDLRAEKSFEAGKTNILEVFKKDLKLDGERAAALGNAIERIAFFLNGGGELDPLVKDAPEERAGQEPGAKEKFAEVIGEVRKNTAATRKLNEKVLLLKKATEPESSPE
jgi:hypothetical protein